LNIRKGFPYISNVLLALLAIAAILAFWLGQKIWFPAPTLLTDPFLQLPTPTSVRVVWFSEFAGARNWVEYGQGQKIQQVAATTTKLSHVREDQQSKVGKQIAESQVYRQPTQRNIWIPKVNIGKKRKTWLMIAAGAMGNISLSQSEWEALNTTGSKQNSIAQNGKRPNTK
jgi:hypothetical protein